MAALDGLTIAGHEKRHQPAPAPISVSHFLPLLPFSLRSSSHTFRPFLWKCPRDNPCNKMLYPSVRTSRFAMSTLHCNHQAHNLRPGEHDLPSYLIAKHSHWLQVVS